MSTITKNRWTARIIPIGDCYGATNSLTNNGNSAMIEFYDNTYASGSGDDCGQMVQRYYLSTLIEHNQNTGLVVDAGIPEWTINAENFEFFMTWAKIEVGITPKKPIKEPANEIIQVLQDVLMTHGKDTLKENPVGYFAFNGAMAHINHCSRLIKVASPENPQNTKILEQLAVLAKYEW